MSKAMGGVGRSTMIVLGISALTLGLACRNLSSDRDPVPISEGGDAIHVIGTREWREANEPLIREYLSTLPESAVGQPLKGIRLSDGQKWLEGYLLVGLGKDRAPGAHIVLLSKDDRRAAYLWMEADAEPLELEPCTDDEMGVRARRIGGEVLPWRSIRADHGIVYTLCPLPAWYPEATPPAS